MQNLFSENIDFFRSHAFDNLAVFQQEPHKKNSVIDTDENPNVCISSTYNPLFDESETLIPPVRGLSLLSHQLLV